MKITALYKHWKNHIKPTYISKKVLKGNAGRYPPEVRAKVESGIKLGRECKHLAQEFSVNVKTIHSWKLRMKGSL
jgi:hypothetical protein